MEGILAPARAWQVWQEVGQLVHCAGGELRGIPRNPSIWVLPRMIAECTGSEN